MKRRKGDENKMIGVSSCPSSLSLLTYPSLPPDFKMHENVIKDADHYQSYPKSPMIAGKYSGPSHQTPLPEDLFQSHPSNYSLLPSLKNLPKYLNHNDLSFNSPHLDEYDDENVDYLLSDQKYTPDDKTAFGNNYHPPKPETLHYKELPQDRKSLEWEDLEEEEVELDDHEEGMDYNGPNSPPLYRGAPISLHESLVSILSLALKFSISGQLLQSLLKLIDIHLPKEDNKFKASLYLFKKYFSNIKGASDYTYYCSICFTECERNGICTICKKRTPQCCLIRLPLVDQIKALMARPGFYSKLIPVASRFNSAGNITDIHDGRIYKEHFDKERCTTYHRLTGEWYADGAEAYKSAKISVWNFFLSINELPYSERFKKENLLVPALWVGPVKPPASFLLKKSIVDFQLLAKGVPMYIADLNQTKDVKLAVVGGTGDTPARALLLNMVAHNGEYPCQFCQQKGKCRDACPGVRVMPYNEEEMIPRTVENFKRHGELAKNMKPTVPSYKGFHGTTPLSKITLNPVRATSIDSMHLLYGGLGKLNLCFFVDPSSSYTSLECHVSKLDRAIINERLLQIKPPHFMTRVPKSIHEIGSWQTSVHKSMFLYYGLPVLKGIIKDAFLTHYATLVAATQYLNADTITPEQMNKASQLIKKYASYFKDLYTEDYMTINFHLVLHLCDVVSEKGPLWTTACFPHEGVNGQILKLIHGPRYPEMQIASSVQMVLNQDNMINDLKPGPAKAFCKDMLSTTNNRIQFCYGENVIVGKWHKINKPLDYMKNLALQDGEYITQFHCLRRQKIIYVAESYNRGNKRDSSAVTYQQYDEEEVGIIRTFIRSSKCQCTACDCPCTLFAVIQDLKVVGLFDTLIPDIPVPNTKEYVREENYKLVPVQSLTTVNVKMELDSGLFISKRCNKHEVE